MSQSWISPESRVSFWAAIACLIVGGVGWLINYLAPGSTQLGALAVVGCFYLLSGVISLKTKVEARPSQSTDSPSNGSARKSDDKTSARRDTKAA